MITVDYSNRDFNSMARTLYPEDLGFHENSGWTVEGEVHEDYYEWVNDFVATHPVFGRIEGNFETEVTAECQLSLDHFIKHHHYSEWDYYDI
jgi:hypothetical protein